MSVLCKSHDVLLVGNLEKTDEGFFEYRTDGSLSVTPELARGAHIWLYPENQPVEFQVTAMTRDQGEWVYRVRKIHSEK